ncbi:MAG TPA: hypothetical protein ENK28_08445 [Aliiroseovarius sp.]|nr:hypothetical protein [Aliiroseovarius sp.]
MLFLTACAQATPEPVRPDIQLIPDAGGLAVAPSGLRIDFGRSPRGVVPVLDKALGAHQVLSLGGCPDGVTQNVAWGDITLTFSRERFVGWRQGSRSQGQVCGL